MESYFDAPGHWGEMPPTEYVTSHPGLFEGRDVYVDGEAGNSSSNAFYLNPLVEGLSGSLRVEASGDVPGDGTTGVNVFGTVRGGVVYAKEIRVDFFQGCEEFLLNVFGLVFFILMCFIDWKTVKSFPYIKEAD